MTTIQDGGMSTAVLDAMNPQKAANKSVAAEAQDRFMTLLVTQMKNQDPLNPLDNAQVTSQLAQLSTVTGIDKLNESVVALMGSYQASQSLQAANMIGHGVLVPGSGVDLEQGQALMGVELTQPVDNVRVTIFDASGREVRKLDLGAQQPGTIPVAWDGKNADGTAAADGRYSFKVEAVLGSEKAEATALQFGLVSSVATNAQGVKLNLPGMGEVKFADVRQIL
ncbi:MAG: flagellar basal-body rod modification protein FlgD [Burkholderiales bacterium]|jgi:flagellar basal-body rod modification protein FlgD